MNGLLMVGAGIAAYKMSNAYTGRTDKIGEAGILSDLITTDATSDVMSKMRGCLENITTQELYNNRGFSALFGQTGETRKANTFRYLINHDQSNKVGSLNEKSRMYFLQKAEKAVQYSRQAEHLFCQIANSNNHQTHLAQAKLHCEDLLYLYTQRDKLISSAMAESSHPTAERITSLSQTEEKLAIINARIKQAESSLQRALDNHPQSEISKAGYEELLMQFQLIKPGEAQSSSKYRIEDFVRFYAFKVKLTTDGEFRGQVRSDFRKYIFTTSVGHLGAGEKLAQQYGRWIRDLLDESSVGDIDSRSGNISQYFMQTVYNVLNDGTSNFCLAQLCIGGDQSQDSKRVPRFNGFPACPGSHYLKPGGSEIVGDILSYYNELSAIVKPGDGSERVLDPLDDTKKKMLLWNLVGGTHSEQNYKTKKGIFFRIDEQLKGFTSKAESAMHSKLVFENKRSIFEPSPLDEFVQALPRNPYLGNRPGQNFQYTYSLNQQQNDPYINRLNILQRIAKRCRLNDLEFPDRQDEAKRNQLSRLISNYRTVIAQVDEQQKHTYEDYFKETLGERLHDEFLAMNRDGQNIVELPAIDEILASGWGVIPADLADECLKSSQARQEKVRQQKFNMVLPAQYDVNAHLNTYTQTIDNLRKRLNESESCQDMKQIIAGLGDLTDVIKFYNHIITEKKEGKEVGLLATPTKLVTLAKLAVLDTKDQINQLYARYTWLDNKYKNPSDSVL